MFGVICGFEDYLRCKCKQKARFLFLFYIFKSISVQTSRKHRKCIEKHRDFFVWVLNSCYICMYISLNRYAYRSTTTHSLFRYYNNKTPTIDDIVAANILIEFSKCWYSICFQSIIHICIYKLWLLCPSVCVFVCCMAAKH